MMTQSVEMVDPSRPRNLNQECHCSYLIKEMSNNDDSSMIIQESRKPKKLNLPPFVKQKGCHSLLRVVFVVAVAVALESCLVLPVAHACKLHCPIGAAPAISFFLN